MLALTGSGAGVQGERARERGQGAGADIDQVVRTEHRRRILALHNAGYRLTLALPATPVFPRTELAVAADRAIHDVWLARLDVAIANAEPIGGAGREVLDDHVRGLDQSPEHLLRFERLEIQQEGALAAIQVPADAGLGRVDL